MITDLLEQMNRRQLIATAKEEGLNPYRYVRKCDIVRAIRNKRANVSHENLKNKSMEGI